VLDLQGLTRITDDPAIDTSRLVVDGQSLLLRTGRRTTDLRRTGTGRARARRITGVSYAARRVRRMADAGARRRKPVVFRVAALDIASGRSRRCRGTLDESRRLTAVLIYAGHGRRQGFSPPSRWMVRSASG
jgi:hypothetical protein